MATLSTERNGEVVATLQLKRDQNYTYSSNQGERVESESNTERNPESNTPTEPEQTELSNGDAATNKHQDTTEELTVTQSPLESLDEVQVRMEGGKEEKPRETWGGKVEFLLTCVAYAVGLGNVWRFPYLVYSNGGGAFLIPYILMLAFLGLPLFFLELALGQYASLGPISIWRMCPLFKGIGYCMVTISSIVAIYYNVIIGFTLFYFFASFTTELPWTHCGNEWNTDTCLESHLADGSSSNETRANATRSLNSSIPLVANTTVGSNVSMTALAQEVAKYTSPAEEYWQHYVLKYIDGNGIERIGEVRWHLCLCLLLAWIIVYCCIIKGIRTSGKAVYFTATFPYLVLFALFIRGVSLPGAWEGIKYYLKPDFIKMRNPAVWKDAAVQILYSLGAGSGGLLAMSSYNKFHNNCYLDAVLVPVINCSTSIFAGFVIFAVLGFMAHTNNVPVDHVVEDGPGLAFIVYPEAISKMYGAPFWSLAFFFMLFTLGLGSQFPTIECISTSFIDEFPSLRSYRPWFTMGVCICFFLLGLPCVTQGGQYVIQLMDKYATSFPLLIVTATECIVVAWIYGYKRFCEDIRVMIGHPPNIYWLVCWIGVTPALSFFLLIATAVYYEGITLKGYVYPEWAEDVGWLLMVAALIHIPIWMIIKFCQAVGSCENCRWVLSGPAAVKSLNLRSLITPTDEWGPALQENRLQQEFTAEKTETDSTREREKIIDSDEIAIEKEKQTEEAEKNKDDKEEKESQPNSTDSYI